MVAKINQYTFDIIEEGNTENVYINTKDGMMRLGLTDYPSQKIYIHSELSYAMKRNTLAHELTHAFLFSMGLDNRDLDEEIVCNVVANICGRVTKICDEFLGK